MSSSRQIFCYSSTHEQLTQMHHTTQHEIFRHPHEQNCNRQKSNQETVTSSQQTFAFMYSPKSSQFIRLGEYSPIITDHIV